MFKKVAFTMYPVQDPQRARAFYEETLGLIGPAQIARMKPTAVLLNLARADVVVLHRSSMARTA